mgnify:CR=1 FL=1
MRVDTTGLPADNWHHFLRLRDLRQVFAEMPLDGISRVLELGAGDGVQTTVLRGMFPKVTPVDIAPSGDVAGMIIADAADLPFEDDSFDLIFSSNVLEHVEQLDVAFNEMKRVLAPGGMMIHSMPTGTWKIVQLLLRPIASGGAEWCWACSGGISWCARRGSSEATIFASEAGRLGGSDSSWNFWKSRI